MNAKINKKKDMGGENIDLTWFKEELAAQSCPSSIFSVPYLTRHGCCNGDEAGTGSQPQMQRV